MTDDISEKINHFVSVTKEAAKLLNQTPEDVREALVAFYKLEDQFPLLGMSLSSQQIVSTLANLDFSKPILLTEVEFKESIIPDGVPIRLVEAVVKNNNEVWQIHRYDQDPHPSNPHGHNMQNGLKLHLGTGELFKKREQVGRIHKKDLLAIREKLTSFSLPPLSI